MLVSEILGLREAASWVLVNTSDELEPSAIEALRRAHRPILPVGPLIEEEHDGGGDECTAWLDAQPPRSVVFAAFGSVVRLGRDEMAEMAAGPTPPAAMTMISSRRQAPPTPQAAAAAAWVRWCPGASSGACSRTAPSGAS